MDISLFDIQHIEIRHENNKCCHKIMELTQKRYIQSATWTNTAALFITTQTFTSLISIKPCCNYCTKTINRHISTTICGQILF